MTIPQFKRAHKAVPFRPFTVQMADGRAFPVPHPDFLFLSPTGRTVILCGENDEFNILDFLQMTEIEMARQSPARP